MNFLFKDISDLKAPKPEDWFAMLLVATIIAGFWLVVS